MNDECKLDHRELHVQVIFSQVSQVTYKLSLN